MKQLKSLSEFSWQSEITRLYPRSFYPVQVNKIKLALIWIRYSNFRFPNITKVLVTEWYICPCNPLLITVPISLVDRAYICKSCDGRFESHDMPLDLLKIDFPFFFLDIF